MDIQSVRDRRRLLSTSWNMLSQLGITMPNSTNMQLKNVAAVMVTVSYPAFAHTGQTINVMVIVYGLGKKLARWHAVDGAAQRG
ncbi:MAG: Flagellar P-ring protein [Sodalis sp.]|nr:MAG: Flagellar P-ring protein [Sodalis sp.]